MKKLFKTFALIALTATTTLAADLKENETNSSNKASNFEVAMYSRVNQGQVRLLLDKAKGTQVMVQLKNEDGVTLYREYISKKSTSYSRYFSLENLESGNYIFVIKNGTETITKEVTKKSETVQEISIK